MLGKLSQTFKGLRPAMEEGIEVINLVGKFIGSLINGIINGVLGNFGNNGLGAQFKSFSKEITEALDNFKGIDSGTVTAAKNVAEALMYITAAEFLNNLNTPLFANDSGMVHFAKEFKLFTDEIAKCDLSSFDEDTVKQFNMRVYYSFYDDDDEYERRPLATLYVSYSNIKYEDIANGG